MKDYGTMRVFGCNAGSDMTDAICEKLNIKRGDALISTFKDGETRIEVYDNVRGADVFVVNPTNPPVTNFTEMMLLGSALRDASAGRVTLVIPYLGYNRQERKDQGRIPFSAQDMIEVLKISRADRVVLLDLHASATAEKFRPIIPDHLYAAYELIPELAELFNGDKFVIASPDAGGVTRARKYADMIARHKKTDEIAELVIFHKRRPKPGEVGDIHIAGEVADHDVLIVDDMIDSGGTLIACAETAKKAGAKRIVAVAVHGLFSDGAVKRLEESPIDEVVIADSIPLSEEAKNSKTIRIVSVAPLFAKAIRLLNEGESFSELFIN
ncbi:phosphoribosylpyrophosphate synthetase [Candidatus Kaiserbacteria bacterium]|nr:MAG: phosphoribosylpyrophosphate synthetase [Candidatus Kaiserbacteria bacterium]